MPTAKGSHDQAVPLNDEVVAVADQQDDDRERRHRRSRRAPPARSRAPLPRATTACATGTLTRPAGIGLPGLRPASPGRVVEVVQGADRDLQRDHRDAELQGERDVGAGDEGDGRHDHAIEQRRERVAEPDDRRRPGAGAPQT